MIKFLALQVIMGRITIDCVPQKYVQDVQSAIAAQQN